MRALKLIAHWSARRWTGQLSILLKRWSGRPGSNRRHPAWEAGVLPLNYSRPRLLKVSNLELARDYHPAILKAIASDGSLSRMVGEMASRSNWLPFTIPTKNIAPTPLRRRSLVE